MKISDIIDLRECLYSNVAPETEFSDITTNPDDVTDSSLLIIPNSAKISHDKNLPQSPVAIICDAPELFPNEAMIIVENPRRTLAESLRRYHNIDFSKFKTIGITGTNGKTSTAAMIKRILTECGHKVGSIGTGSIEIDGNPINEKYYSMTTPDPELLYETLKKMEREGCTAVIMEVSSHALALEKVSAIPFDYGIFTNLGEDHLDFHGNKDRYFEAKLKLFSICKTAIFNIDDPYVRRALGLSRTERTINTGVIWRGDVYATDVENRGLDGISYMYHGKNFIFKMNLRLAGIYNVYNSLLASALAIDMGCKPCEVKKAVESIEEIHGRYEIIKGDVTAIIDYAHTPTAFEAILKELRALSENDELWVVFGCGGQRDREKRPQMAKIAEKYTKNIIVTSDNPRDEDKNIIFEDIKRGFSEEHQIIENRKEAIKKAILSAKENSLIAIIGKGCEPYYIDKIGYHDYSERRVVEEALTERRMKNKYANKA